MGNLALSSAQTSNMENNVENISVDSRSLDSIQDQEETRYVNSDTDNEIGIYKTIPEFKIALDMRSIWTVGNEIVADNRTKVLTDNFDGWGKDTFRNILKNMVSVKRMCKDSYAEIVRDEQTDTPINLKPLNPGTIEQIYNREGRLVRYEQINRANGKTIRKYKPDEILHLTNKRIGDEIHGVADSEALNAIITASKENFDDVRKFMHRFVKPIMKFMLDTDNATEIAAYAAKMDKAVNLGENIYIPKDVVTTEVISVPANATLNPLPWRDHLKNYFFQVVGIPQIILGSSGEFTESTAKIAYVAFQQSVKDEQRDIEEQIWDQLQLRIKLSAPTEIRNELLNDTKKDGQDQQTGFQEGDMAVSQGE